MIIYIRRYNYVLLLILAVKCVCDALLLLSPQCLNRNNHVPDRPMLIGKHCLVIFLIPEAKILADKSDARSTIHLEYVWKVYCHLEYPIF